MQASNSCRRTGKDCPGRKATLTPELFQIVVDWLEDNGFPARTNHWDEICWDLQLPVKGEALRRKCRQEGIRKSWAIQKPFHTKKDQERRREFCALHQPSLGWDVERWKLVILSDEVHITVDMRNQQWVIRRGGKRFEEFATQD